MTPPIIALLVVSCIALTAADPVADGTPRLVGGPSEAEGKLEVAYQGQWYSVCSVYFDHYAATVACRGLGIRGYARAIHNYDDSPDNVYITDVVECDGTEADILSCRNHGVSPDTECDSVTSAVGIKCDGLMHGLDEVRFTLEPEMFVHPLEVKYKGEWTTFCSVDGDFFMGVAVCRMMGEGGNGLQGATATSQPPTAGLFIQCYSGKEASLDECYVDFEGTCDASNVAGLWCNIPYPCGAGSYANATYSDCVFCPQGFYQPLHGADWCEECPPGTQTKGEGTVYVTGCLDDIEFDPEVVYIKEEIVERYYDNTEENLMDAYQCMTDLGDIPERDLTLKRYIDDRIEEAITADDAALVDKLNELLHLEKDMRTRVATIDGSAQNQEDNRKDHLFDLYDIRQEL